MVAENTVFENDAVAVPVIEGGMTTETQQVEKTPLPQLDHTTFASQLFWLVIVFSALYYIMARHILPRIHTVIENRQQRIEYDLDRAASLKAEAEHARESYESALAEARGQAQKMLNDVAEAIRKTSEEKHNELDDILNGKVAESEQLIHEAKLKADRDLEPTAAEVAVSLVEKLSGQKVDAKAMLKRVTGHNKTLHRTGKRAA
jgi:F-type H+-transporting ATPase subunit b